MSTTVQAVPRQEKLTAEQKEITGAVMTSELWWYHDWVTLEKVDCALDYWIDSLLRRSPDKVIVLEEMKKHVGGVILDMVADRWATRDVDVTRWQYGAVEMKEAFMNLCFRTSRDLGGEHHTRDVLFLPGDRHERGHGREAQWGQHDPGDGIDVARLRVLGGEILERSWIALCPVGCVSPCCRQ